MKKIYLIVATFFILSSLHAEEKTESKKEVPPSSKEEVVETSHSVTIDGKTIAYKAIAGNIVLKDDQGKEKASIFYVAYIKDGERSKDRPITYSFNGGPGSASIWLHLGVFGPQRVAYNEEGPSTPPYATVNNDYSILDLTDLVFIDPVSTGYSRPAPGEDAKQFHGVEEDVESIGKFIRIFSSRYDRWDSPKYLAGESYGTTRAVALSEQLFEKHRMYINGLVLLSSILNFQTLSDPQNGNDLPYAMSLPTFTATAWYHKKLAPELQEDFGKALKLSEEFALGDYSLALLQGDLIDPKKKEEIIDRLAYFSGLSRDFVSRSNMRVNNFRFAKELLRSDRRTVGRFDSRFKGIDSDAVGAYTESDPSADAIFGPFAGAFNEYVRTQLNWKEDKEYNILVSLGQWNYSKTGNSFLNVAEKLREVMTVVPGMRVFVGNGYFDLATPYFGSDYTMNHLGLDPSLRPYLTMKYYEAGHMMYIHPESLVKMKKDLVEFYTNPGPKVRNPISR